MGFRIFTTIQAPSAHFVVDDAGPVSMSQRALPAAPIWPVEAELGMPGKALSPVSGSGGFPQALCISFESL